MRLVHERPDAIVLLERDGASDGSVLGGLYQRHRAVAVNSGRRLVLFVRSDEPSLCPPRS